MAEAVAIADLLLERSEINLPLRHEIQAFEVGRRVIPHGKISLTPGLLWFKQ